MTSVKPRRWRHATGTLAAVAAACFFVWLLLALIFDVPMPEIKALEQSGIRLLAECTVVSLLIAAIAFWDGS